MKTGFKIRRHNLESATRICFKKLETARTAYDCQVVEFKTSCVNNKCVQRELRVPRTAERFGVQPPYYYRLPMWLVMCVTKNVMVEQTLGWFVAYPEKTISVPWFGRDFRHGGRADNNNKTVNNAKYSNCKGLNHETYDVSLQNLRLQPFWNLSSLQILFLSVLCLFTS